MSAIVALSSLLLAVPALAQQTPSGSCSDVHIIAARGWNEPYPGRQGELADAICADLPNSSCDYEDVVYTTTQDYCPAVEDGYTAANSALSSYTARCPDSKIILSGYSQGASIIGDVLAGGGGQDSCANTPALDTSSEEACSIAAVLLFGDPRHTADQSYNVLDGSSSNGEFPRTAQQVSNLNYYSGRLRSWCNANDLACTQGTDLEAHTNYMELYTDSAASWAVSKVNSASSSCVKSSSSSSSAQQTSTSSSSSSKASSSAPASTSAEMTTSAGMTTSAPATTSAAMTSSEVSSYDITYLTSSSSTKASSYISSSMYMNSTTTGAATTSAPVSKTTMISGKPCVIGHSTTAYTTTWANFPPIVATSTYPATTSWIGWGNGTASMTSAVSGSGVASGTGAGAKPTGPAPYTGAASNTKVSGVAFAFAVAVMGFMMA